MATLIDGYNLIHAAGILTRNIGPGTLERARNALVGFLTGSMTDAERSKTTVVFDTRESRDGPCEEVFEGVRVVYAIGYESADALIEELIRANSAPRHLVVVSSDQRIQRAARRRRATAIDSQQWYNNLKRQRREAARPQTPPEKPDAPTSDEEVEFWLGEFGES